MNISELKDKIIFITYKIMSAKNSFSIPNSSLQNSKILSTNKTVFVLVFQHVSLVTTTRG